ncbi:MAG: epoxyqueuosine reductase QueH [Actinomycetota bacterium]|nr:epoxyqueuosine reductase QueH [Actinomycetota bacterium]
MKILLHACCGPCLLEPFDAIAREHDVVVAYANPNIHPASEYRARRDTLMEYARDAGIEVAVMEYDPVQWMRAVAGLEDVPAQRCRACYALRLGMVAREAHAKGYDAIATTLTVSPYQDADAIADEGRRAAAQAGVEYLHYDFRERYADATRRSRELGMYRQNYCGCLLSEIEADADRTRRRAERAAAKAAKLAQRVVLGDSD